MTSQTNIPAEQVSFKEFLFKNQRNKQILIIAAIALIIQFVIFKYLYPFISYIHGDSFSYLRAAADNLDINTYPIGYSRFLRLFSVITSSDTALAAFQYLFIQASALFLLFTIFYFYKPGKITQYILLGFTVFNPLFLHLGNLVSSDCIFAGLSLSWFGLLLWIIHRPTNQIIFWHTVVLGIAFTVRYNALIYPFIAVVAFWLSALPIRKKIAGILAGLVLVGLFITYTSYKYKQLTGYWQFSPFSGWQLANNAMYAYRYVDSVDRKPVAPKYQALDTRITQFFDSTRNTAKYKTESIKASTFYMWSPGMPLMKYRNSLYTKAKDTNTTELKKWASMGPFYKEYGIYIIKKYPWHFLTYFVWPNAQKYYSPPVEFLQTYNSSKRGVSPQAKEWFHYKSQLVKVRMNSGHVWVLNFYPILSGIINVVMLFGLLFYLTLKGWKRNTLFNKTLIIGVTVWLLNALFTIVVSSAALRFQSFPVLLTTTFALLLIDWMMQLIKSMKLEENKQRVLNEELVNKAMA
jgi:hypothetical protein